MWLVGTSVCDIVIAVSMLYYMRHARTGFRATTTLLTKIIRVSIETGLICATFALLDLSIFLAYPHNNYHIPICMCLSKIYSNSLLAVRGIAIMHIAMKLTVERGVGAQCQGPHHRREERVHSPPRYFANRKRNTLVTKITTTTECSS